MLIESKDGQIKRQRCHKCGSVREQDYLRLVKVGDTVEFECADGCDYIDLTDEDGNIETHKVVDGIITTVLMFCLGASIGAAIIWGK